MATEADGNTPNSNRGRTGLQQESTGAAGVSFHTGPWALVPARQDPGAFSVSEPLQADKYKIRRPDQSTSSQVTLCPTLLQGFPGKGPGPEEGLLGAGSPSVRPTHPWPRQAWLPVSLIPRGKVGGHTLATSPALIWSLPGSFPSCLHRAQNFPPLGWGTEG